MITFQLSEFEWIKEHKILLAKDFMLFQRHMTDIWESGPGKDKSFFIAGRHSIRLFLRISEDDDWQLIYKVYPAAKDIYAYRDEHNQFMLYFVRYLGPKVPKV